MVSYYPWRAVDLLKYQLLILRTQAQFGGQAWLNYDEAFRRDAAARSCMHVELYPFHTASTRLPATPPPACFLRARELVSPPVFAVPGMLDVASVLALFAAI
jgi:hypothetical protein